MDTKSPQQRHKNMAAIRSADTKPEMTVRRWLHSRGFRYRLNHRGLPGHPDIVLRKYRTCIFVNGCFWHGHEGCRYFRLPKTNIDFWRTKIERNRERDRRDYQALARLGWHTIVIWECSLRPAALRRRTLESLEQTLYHIYLADREVGNGPSRTLHYPLHGEEDGTDEKLAAEP